METLLFVCLGLVVGAAMGWLACQVRVSSRVHSEKSETQNTLSGLQIELETLKARSNLQMQNERERITEKIKEIIELKEQLSLTQRELTLRDQTQAQWKANHEALKEKLETQNVEMEKIGKKFNLEFENIANRILDSKTEKFTELNKDNLKSILDPLGKNIIDFKSRVEEVYDKESKERFSLGKEVTKLAQLNHIISEEAKNLTKALKGEAKTQGRWGEMILESMLEKSGLVKNREYFYGPGQAMGQSFAVPPGTKIPPSLLNIFKEVELETGQRPNDSELMSWVDQGVFLLNSVLTVRRGEAFSHAGKGWEHFTNGVIEALGNRGTPLVFLLWGSAAWQKKSLIRGKHHLILESPHPSPLSAYRGFFGNGHFLKTNEFLKKNRMLPISWS